MAVEALLIEGAKLALQIYFTNAKLAGKTDEDIEAIFFVEKTKFDQNKPEDLPDV